MNKIKFKSEPRQIARWEYMALKLCIITSHASTMLNMNGQAKCKLDSKVENEERDNKYGGVRGDTEMPCLRIQFQALRFIFQAYIYIEFYMTESLSLSPFEPSCIFNFPSPSIY